MLRSEAYCLLQQSIISRYYLLDMFCIASLDMSIQYRVNELLGYPCVLKFLKRRAMSLSCNDRVSVSSSSSGLDVSPCHL